MERFKICALCGKEFEAANSKHIYCSKNCVAKMHYIRNKDQISQERRKRSKVIPCKICGKPVPPDIRDGRACRKHLHQDCVIIAAYKAILAGEGCKNKDIMRAQNQGYKSMTEIMRLGRQILKGDFQ